MDAASSNDMKTFTEQGSVSDYFISSHSQPNQHFDHDTTSLSNTSYSRSSDLPTSRSDTDHLHQIIPSATISDGANVSCPPAPIKVNSQTKKRKEVQKKITDNLPVKKRKLNRFNGMSEEEVLKHTLPDYLQHDLDIVFIGINPGLSAAYAGRYYTGPGNHFWKCLHLSGLISEPMSAIDDYKLLSYGIGFTNMVSRTTRGSSDLSRAELVEGSKILLKKIQQFTPKIIVFNGKISYEIFSGTKKFYFGKQNEFVEGTETRIWVMPSSSARCAQLPRAVDKVPFFEGLMKFRDYLNGVTVRVNEDEFVFKDIKLTNVKKVINDKKKDGV